MAGASAGSPRPAAPVTRTDSGRLSSAFQEFLTKSDAELFLLNERPLTAENVTGLRTSVDGSTGHAAPTTTPAKAAPGRPRCITVPERAGLEAEDEGNWLVPSPCDTPASVVLPYNSSPPKQATPQSDGPASLHGKRKNVVEKSARLSGSAEQAPPGRAGRTLAVSPGSSNPRPVTPVAWKASSRVGVKPADTHCKRAPKSSRASGIVTKGRDATPGPAQTAPARHAAGELPPGAKLRTATPAPTASQSRIPKPAAARDPRPGREAPLAKPEIEGSSNKRAKTATDNLGLGPRPVQVAGALQHDSTRPRHLFDALNTHCDVAQQHEDGASERPLIADKPCDKSDQVSAEGLLSALRSAGAPPERGPSSEVSEAHATALTSGNPAEEVSSALPAAAAVLTREPASAAEQTYRPLMADPAAEAGKHELQAPEKAWMRLNGEDIKVCCLDPADATRPADDRPQALGETAVDKPDIVQPCQEPALGALRSDMKGPAGQVGSRTQSPTRASCQCCAVM